MPRTCYTMPMHPLRVVTKSNMLKSSFGIRLEPHGSVSKGEQASQDGPNNNYDEKVNARTQLRPLANFGTRRVAAEDRTFGCPLSAVHKVSAGSATSSASMPHLTVQDNIEHGENRPSPLPTSEVLGDPFVPGPLLM